MGVPRFFVASSFDSMERYSLSRDLAHRAIRVMRLREGDELAIFDGSGLEATGRLHLGSGSQASLVELRVRTPAREGALDLILGQPVLARDRLHYSIEKACELGVSRIVLVECERSASSAGKEVKPSKLDHLARIVISAIEQSGRTQIPSIEGPVSLTSFVSYKSGTGPRLLLDPLGPPLQIAQLRETVEVESAMLLVGPEGGLTVGEVATAMQAGFSRFALGPRMLRTETAVVVGLTLLQATIGDWPGERGTR